MNFGNVVRLPGSTFKSLFEVTGSEFKARPVSKAVDFSPASSSAVVGRVGFNRAVVLQVSVMEGAEGISKGVAVGNCEKEGREGIEGTHGEVIGSIN